MSSFWKKEISPFKRMQYGLVCLSAPKTGLLQRRLTGFVHISESSVRENGETALLQLIVNPLSAWTAWWVWRATFDLLSPVSTLARPTAA